MSLFAGGYVGFAACLVSIVYTVGIDGLLSIVMVISYLLDSLHDKTALKTEIKRCPTVTANIGRRHLLPLGKYHQSKYSGGVSFWTQVLHFMHIHPSWEINVTRWKPHNDHLGCPGVSARAVVYTLVAVNYKQRSQGVAWRRDRSPSNTLWQS